MERSVVSLDYVEPNEVARIVRNEEESNRNNYVILDVRDEEEYSDGHIKTAKSLPSEKWQDAKFVQDVVNTHLDYDTIIVHCFYSKVRGPTCARQLVKALEAHLLEHPREQIPKVRIMRGGYNAFSSQYGTFPDLIEKEE